MSLAAGTAPAAIFATAGEPRVRPEPVRALMVGQVLDSAAANAEKRQAEGPDSHQWIYIDVMSCDDDCGHVPS